MKIFFTCFKLLLVLSLLLPYHGDAQQITPVCGTNDSLSAARLLQFGQRRDLKNARTANEEKLEYRLALDVNYNTYLLYGKDKELITRTAVQFINRASEIFEREINVKLTITSILIWDKREPYALDNDFEYFSNVLNYWTFNRNDERDAVVSLSTRYGWFYGGYRMCSSNFPAPDASDLEVDLLCHELGHTLGSPHTHSCSWPGGPIDRCTALEGAGGDCEEGYQESVNGSLMSYCRSVLSFHPLCQSLMRNYAEGNVDQSFKLLALAENPNSPDSLVIYEGNAQNASHTPSFRWKTPFGAGQYHFQIARDAGFTNIVEDTLITQSHFTSAGQAQGNYFARVLSVQTPKAATWSTTLPFTIGVFNENAASPLLMQVSWKNDGFVKGKFQKYEGIDACQIELLNNGQPDNSVVHNLTVTADKMQHFSIPLEKINFFRFGIRMRVRKEQMWSQWSHQEIIRSPWDSSLWPQTNVTGTSASPVMASSAYVSTMHNGFSQYIEVASDPDFSNLVHRDSVKLSEMNQPYVNKVVFQPDLDENQTYHARTRVQYMPGIYSSWNKYQIQTKWKDERFEFLGPISKNLLTTNNLYDTNFRPRFYNAGNKLYVYGGHFGYYSTTDLKNWDSYTIATTKGKSPNSINYFGVSRTDDVFAMSFNNVLLKRNAGGMYEQNTVDAKFSTDELSQLIVTASSGIFFKTVDRGVGHFLNGNWHFFGEGILANNQVTCIAADAQDQIWAVMEGGLVYSFSGDIWTAHPQLPARDVSGIIFDQEQNPYAYGSWGISKLNKSNRTWDVVVSVRDHFIRKVIFDKDNRMWAAAFGFSPEFTPFALIKYENQQTSIYSDGLNFLKEAFDLTIFNDKLLIMTTGGELYTFNDENIQRFIPKPGYCPGDEIDLTLATNSSFATENKTSFIFKSTTGEPKAEVSGEVVTGNQFKINIPAELPEGTYQLQTNTTSPYIRSNVSPSFVLYQTPPAPIAQVQQGEFVTLTTADGKGLHYQWQRDGQDIISANNASLRINEPGNYAVIVSNEGGCINKSLSLTVRMDAPAEVTLLQNAPNPIGLTTDISFFLPTPQAVKLSVYDSRGHEMVTLAEGNYATGWHLARFEARNLPSGVYIYQLKAENLTKTLKMVR